ncbi:MAG TPA: hypothetical protein VFM82_07695 [Flavobacteriaceae bacterium]|nr:hypothetical protein [Flavobacteriaceae bacterium]
MNLWIRIKKLRPKQLLKLALVFCGNPRFAVSSIRATNRTLAICNFHFGKKHHQNNQANAFRHALWNFFICRAVFQIDTDVEKAINWAKTITDLHEKFAFSTNLAKAMDLHNNTIGRTIFKEKISAKLNLEEIIVLLKTKAAQAEKIEIPEDVEKFKGELVFIE